MPTTCTIRDWTTSLTRYTTVWTAPAATTTTRRSRTTARTCGRTIPVPSKVDINIGHVGGVIVALIIAVCVANSQAAKYKKRAPVSARRYMDGSLTRFTQRGDVFVREYTTSHRISSSSSGGSRHSGGGGHRSGGGGGRRR